MVEAGPSYNTDVQHGLEKREKEKVQGVLNVTNSSLGVMVKNTWMSRKPQKIKG